MSAREAVGGAIAGGGGGVGGYVVVNKYVNQDDTDKDQDLEVEAPKERQEKQQDQQPEETVLQALTSSTGEDGYGKPISSTKSAANYWWIKAYHRYFLEVSDSDGLKIEEVGGEGLRTSWTKNNSHKQLQEACEELYKKPKSEEESLKKAKKWCVTYETVQDMLSSESETKNLKSQSDSVWSTKYDTAVGDDSFPYKALLEKAKDIKGGSDEDSNKRSAMHKWCEAGMHSSTETIKDLVEKYCYFVDNSLSEAQV